MPIHDGPLSAMEQTTKTPNLVASTSDTYCCSIAESRIRERRLQDVKTLDIGAVPPVESNEDLLEVNYFKSAQW